MMIKLEDDGMGGVVKDGNEPANANENENKNLTDYSLFFTKFDEHSQQNYLSDALAFIKSEVNSLKEKIRMVDENIVDLNKEIGEEKYI